MPEQVMTQKLDAVTKALDSLAVHIIQTYEWETAKFLLLNLWDVCAELDTLREVVEDQESVDEENKLFEEVDAESKASVRAQKEEVK